MRRSISAALRFCSSCHSSSICHPLCSHGTQTNPSASSQSTKAASRAHPRPPFIACQVACVKLHVQKASRRARAWNSELIPHLVIFAGVEELAGVAPAAVTSLLVILAHVRLVVEPDARADGRGRAERAVSAAALLRSNRTLHPEARAVVLVRCLAAVLPVVLRRLLPGLKHLLSQRAAIPVELGLRLQLPRRALVPRLLDHPANALSRNVRTHPNTPGDPLGSRRPRAPSTSSKSAYLEASKAWTSALSAR